MGGFSQESWSSEPRQIAYIFVSGSGYFGIFNHEGCEHDVYFVFNIAHDFTKKPRQSFSNGYKLTN